MYMDKSAILWPPDAGWLDITVNNLRDLGKADEVVLLLRRLPYLACQPDASYRCWSSSHWILFLARVRSLEARRQHRDRCYPHRGQLRLGRGGWDAPSTDYWPRNKSLG